MQNHDTAIMKRFRTDTHFGTKSSGRATWLLCGPSSLEAISNYFRNEDRSKAKIMLAAKK